MSNQPKIMTQEAKCGVRLNYVVFPIDIRELSRALAKNGYELPPSRRLPSPPAQLSYGGDLARKGEITLIIESASGDIGVVGRSLEEVKTAFKELEQIINSELGVNLHENLRFYWYTVHYKVDTGKMPLNKLTKILKQDYMTRFGEVLGENLSSFSVRLIPKDAILNDENWFDIAIEPDLLNEKLYHVGVVFRSPDATKTETFVRDLDNTLLKLLEVIEE